MILVDASSHFRKAVAYMEGSLNGEPHEVDLAKAEGILNEILNYNVGELTILFALGSLHLSRGNSALAIQILTSVVSQRLDYGEAWNNLGLAWKNVPDGDPKAFEKAEVALRQAAKYFKGEALADIYCNLAAIKVGRNSPEDVLKWVEKALEASPGHEKAIWHQGLAYLELRRWDVAWEAHDARLRGGAPGEIAVRNYHGPDGMTPTWDGKSPGLIVIHGEQGVGDEIMFATCIHDALKVPGTRFVFEPGPRMEKLFARTFPEIKVFGTHDTDGRGWIGELGKPDYKIPLGSLPRLFRRSPEAFTGRPYLVADAAKRQWWGDKLNALGRRPNIGIAWQGGVAKTRYDARSFHPAMYKPMFDAVDANWISLQYDPTAQHCVNEVRDNLGVKLVHWPKAVEQRDPDTGKLSDIDELVALISKLDCVVTVNQTAVHVAGALGVPTITLTPSEPSWRYSAGEHTDMPWYDSVKQVRQPKGTKAWEPVIEEATANLVAFLRVMDQAAGVAQ